ncbi:hypothetical protein EVAR_16687_1 [Eumeta japonica]|uniref:Uncharacterized protein n=1 Tax=Eumeta variegata TaxID=151549 RepID=A0A4C1V4E3_EUMVA|nr:hypothetical protein EVAR_16687_1 [Eumeta japonica]
MKSLRGIAASFPRHAAATRRFWFCSGGEKKADASFTASPVDTARYKRPINVSFFCYERRGLCSRVTRHTDAYRGVTPREVRRADTFALRTFMYDV